MKLSENRPLACGILAVVIAGVLFIGGGNALDAKGKAVESAFSTISEDQTISSIAADLKESADDVEKMNSIALNAKGVNQTFTTAAADAIQSLRAADSISDRYDAYVALSTAAENLYSNVSNLTSLSEADAKEFHYQYKNYESAQHRIDIAQESYNAQVTAFNREKSGFPAGLISAVRGIKDAVSFN